MPNKVLRIIVATLVVLASSASAQTNSDRPNFSTMTLPIPSGPGAGERLDITSTIGNHDPRALEYGLLFPSTMPVQNRKIIIDDLTWLSSLGVLKNTELFNKLENVTTNSALAGADIVAWFLARVRIVADLAWCGDAHNVLVTVKRWSDVGDIVTPEPHLIDRCSFPDDAHPLMQARTEGLIEPPKSEPSARDADGVALDRLLVLFSPTTTLRPIVHTGPAFFTRYTGSEYSDDKVARIVRLSGLLHEAKHIEGGHFHVVCSGWNSSEISLRIESVGASNLPGAHCDTGFDGAETLTAAFLRLMADNCPGCNAAELVELKWQEKQRWLRVQVHLAAPTLVPEKLIDSRTTNLQGKLLRIVPPKAYFIALIEQGDLEFNRCPDLRLRATDLCRYFIQNFARGREEVERLIEHFQLLETRGGMESNWSNVVSERVSEFSKPAIGKWASLWIANVQNAEASGYNLPMKWAPPCNRFPGVCRAPN